MEFPVLVGDIGGTNSRFALVRDFHSTMEIFDPVLTNSYSNIEEAIEAAVLAKTSLYPKSMVLAIAAPIFGDSFKMTNADITVEPKQTMKKLGLSHACIMNDFPAQSLGVLATDHKQMHRIGGGEFREDGTRIVVGPGTSFGISTLVNCDGKWTILPAEGACADMGLGTGRNSARELEIQSFLEKRNDRQTVETLLSGPGLENIYQAICRADNRPLEPITAATISAHSHSNPAANEAVQLMSTLLGRVAGNLALSVMATGGVYITGGMAYKMMSQLVEGNFRSEFEYKSPHASLAKTIPTWFVNREHVALEGLANYVRMGEQYDLTQASKWYQLD